MRLNIKDHTGSKIKLKERGRTGEIAQNTSLNITRILQQVSVLHFLTVFTGSLAERECK